MEWSGIAIFYFACLTLGFISVLLSVLLGEIGSHVNLDVGDHSLDIGHEAVQFEIGHEAPQIEMGGGDVQGIDASHAVDVGGHGEGFGSHEPGASVFNGITMSTFTAFFGLTGLVAVWGFHMPALISLAVSLPASFIIAAAQFLIFLNVFVKAQASSEATLSEVLGSEADVAVSIPGDRVGQITYVIRGSRFTAPAVSSDASDIAGGTKVVIVNVRGNMLVVRPVQ